VKKPSGEQQRRIPLQDGQKNRCHVTRWTIDVMMWPEWSITESHKHSMNMTECMSSSEGSTFWGPIKPKTIVLLRSSGKSLCVYLPWCGISPLFSNESSVSVWWPLGETGQLSVSPNQMEVWPVGVWGVTVSWSWRSTTKQRVHPAASGQRGPESLAVKLGGTLHG